MMMMKGFGSSKRGTDGFRVVQLLNEWSIVV